MACKPYYDSRHTVSTILAMINKGTIPVPENASIVHFQARGQCYTAKKDKHNIYSISATWRKVEHD
jgi:hypothetical protein